jgi:hypothetical protein
MTPANDQSSTSPKCRRSCSILISSTHCKENGTRNLRAQVSSHQTTHNSQSSVLPNVPRKSRLIIKQKRKRSSWNIFRNFKSSEKFVEENKKLSVSYSLTPTSPNDYSEPGETVHVAPLRTSSSVHTFGNNSLRDAEDGLATAVRQKEQAA